MEMKNFRRHLTPWKARLCVFAAAIVCYLTAYDGAFVFDDAEAIVNNRDVRWRAEENFWAFLGHDFWGSPIRSNASHKSYRPLTVLSFRMNHWLSGMDTRSYHLVNIFLHATVSSLSFDFFSAIFKDLKIKTTFNAFLSALLFAVHPIHSECVANIVGRAELLSGLFFILSFLSFRSERNHDSSYPKTLLFALVAMLSKEQGITVLGFCLAYDLLLLSKPIILKVFTNGRRILSDIENNNDVGKLSSVLAGNDVKQQISRSLILSAGAGLSLALRAWIMGFEAPQFTELDNPSSFHESLLVRAINYHYIYALNCWLLLNPTQLCFDYSMGCVSLITSLWDPRLFAVVTFWATVAAALLYIGTKQTNFSKILTISLALLVIPFLPASNLLFRVGFVIAERVLYLPSLGYCLLIGYALGKQESSRGLCLLLLLFSGKCYQRSNDWRSEEALFSAGALVCPNNAKVHYNLGKILSDAGFESDAESKYRQALRLNPNYDQAMNNLANLLKDKGKFIEAEQLLLKAIQIRSDFSAAWMNLAIAQTGLQKYSEAELAYLRALKHRPFYPDCYFNLGNLYLEQGRYSEAFSAWTNATQQRPTHAKAWINKLIMLDNQNDCDSVVHTAHEALVHLPGQPSVHFSLGSCLGKLGKLSEAEEHIVRAIKSDPGNANYYGNLGVLYHRWKREREAEEMYLRALTLDPQLVQVKRNLELLRKDHRL